MTLASTHAIGLMEILAERASSGEGLKGIAAPYFERTHGFTSSVWQGLENLEFSYAATKGERPKDIDMRMAFTRGLRKLVEEDPEVQGMLMRVGNLVLAPDALQRPDIADRVVRFIKEGA